MLSYLGFAHIIAIRLWTRHVVDGSYGTVNSGITKL